jgi:tetratricopeptide (TPR) repeat protein
LLALRQLREAPDEALKNLRRAVELSGVTNDASRLRLSQALTERGRLEESTHVLDGLLSVLPQHPAARLELARVSLTRGSVGDVPNLLVPSLTNPYTARPAHLLLAQALLRSGQAEASARHAQTAAALPKPFDWPDPFLREVQELRRDGRKMAEQVQQFMTERRWPEAEALVNDLLIRFPEDAEGMLLLGRIRLQQRRCDAAETLFRRVLNRQPESPLAWMQLGMSHYCQSQWKPAAVAFEQAVRLKADFGQAHFNLGMARIRLGDSAGAISSLREALRTTPGDPSIHVALAEELHRSGDPSGASQYLTRALALDPAFPKALKLQERLRAEK